eukprot:130720-Chlamydomonas_euryale.AAC.2
MHASAQAEIDFDRLRQMSTLPPSFWTELHAPGAPAVFDVRGGTYLKDRRKVWGCGRGAERRRLWGCTDRRQLAHTHKHPPPTAFHTSGTQHMSPHPPLTLSRPIMLQPVRVRPKDALCQQPGEPFAAGGVCLATQHTQHRAQGGARAGASAGAWAGAGAGAQQDAQAGARILRAGWTAVWLGVHNVSMRAGWTAVWLGVHDVTTQKGTHEDRRRENGEAQTHPGARTVPSRHPHPPPPHSASCPERSTRPPPSPPRLSAKVNAGLSAFTLSSVDFFKLPHGKVEHVARFLPTVRQSGAPFAIVVNLIIPGARIGPPAEGGGAQLGAAGSGAGRGGRGAVQAGEEGERCRQGGKGS